MAMSTRSRLRLCEASKFSSVTEIVRWPMRTRKICEAVCVAIVGEALTVCRPPAAGRSCIAARSRTRARMTLALNLAMGRRGGKGGPGNAGAGLVMHRQLHRPSPAVLPSSSAQAMYTEPAGPPYPFKYSLWAATQTVGSSVDLKWCSLIFVYLPEPNMLNTFIVK